MFSMCQSISALQQFPSVSVYCDGTKHLQLYNMNKLIVHLYNMISSLAWTLSFTQHSEQEASVKNNFSTISGVMGERYLLGRRKCKYWKCQLVKFMMQGFNLMPHSCTQPVYINKKML